MKRNKLALVATVGLFASACQTSIVSMHLPVTLIDQPDRGQLALMYSNETNTFICLAIEDWPNEFGNLHEASRTVFLVVEGQRFPFEENNMGYCVGQCTMKIAPRQQLHASIPYEKFDLPVGLHKAPKELVYSPAAHVCTSRELRDSKKVVQAPPVTLPR
jgi:hypothetical protein